MGCEAGVINELCELYPKTAENLRMRSLEKRAVFLYYMGEPSSIIRNQIKIKKSQNSKSERSSRTHISTAKHHNTNSEDMHIFELLNLVPQEDMINPVFLKEEGAEEEDDEATSEI